MASFLLLLVDVASCGKTYDLLIVVMQASARSAPQGTAPSARQVSSLSLPDRPDQPVTITADRHATYSESELAEAETGEPNLPVQLKQQD